MTLRAADYDVVWRGRDADWYGPDGKPALVYRPGALRPEVAGRAALLRAVTVSHNAGDIRRGLVGYTEPDRGCRYPRVTPFTRDGGPAWRAFAELLRDLDRVYRAAAPAAYRLQECFVKLIHPDYRVHGSAFTTAVVNDTVAHPLHRHKGNLHLGLSVMTVLRRSHYEGGYLVLPEFRVAVDMGDRDVLLFPGGALHGNTPLRGAGRGDRLSIVAFVRAKLLHAGSAREENERVNRPHRR
jgi:hypothetical protein